MTLATEHTFLAQIKSKGQQGNGWKLEFDWKLPSSKFPFVLYGKDSDDIDGWSVGDFVEVTIERGNLKDGKDGRYATDYFYDLVSIDTPDDSSQQATVAPVKKPEAPANKSGTNLHPVLQTPRPETPQDAIQHRIEVGMAFNAAYTLLASTAKVYESNIAQGCRDIRLLRDRLYHEVIRMPVAALHYCYEHETNRIQNPKSGNWAHQLPDQTWCVEGASVTHTITEPKPK